MQVLHITKLARGIQARGQVGRQGLRKTIGRRVKRLGQQGVLRQAVKFIVHGRPGQALITQGDQCGTVGGGDDAAAACGVSGCAQGLRHPVFQPLHVECRVAQRRRHAGVATTMALHHRTLCIHHQQLGVALADVDHQRQFVIHSHCPHPMWNRQGNGSATGEPSWLARMMSAM